MKYYSSVKEDEVLIQDWLNIGFWEFMENDGNVLKLDDGYGCRTL